VAAKLDYCLEDFDLLGLLGKGAFGRVYLCQVKEGIPTNLPPGTQLAMKVMPKKDEVQLKYWKEEREILAMSDNPFVIKLFMAFQNTKFLFLVMEMCPCGNLKKALDTDKKFSEKVTRSYIAEILISIEYLHSKDILYRDLKPDNILVDGNGHLKLNDFGLSKTNVGENYASTTFCGTPAYMAPDVIKEIPYGKTVDWYCVGVLLYEFLHS